MQPLSSTPFFAQLPLPDWLLSLLSVDAARLEGAKGQLRLAHFPEGGWGLLALCVLLLAVGGVVWTYRREGSVSRTRKLVMTATRVLLVLLVALALAYPVLEVDRVQQIRATTIVLVDESLSQSIKDRYLSSSPLRDAIAAALSVESEKVATMSRAEIVEHALQHPEWRVLERLAREQRLKVYGFARPQLDAKASVEAVRADADGGASETDDRTNGSAASSSATVAATGREVAGDSNSRLSVRLNPTGDVTDLAGALRTAVESEAGTRIAGIVVLTDGRVTGGEDLGGVATYLRQQNIPVFAVGVGDPTPTRNVRISNVLTGERVFVGDPIAVDVRLEHKGYGGETVRLELYDQHQPGGGVESVERLLQARDVEFDDSTTELSASFKIEPEGLGVHRLFARIEVRPDEAFADDNERSRAFEVVEEASNVLMISGGPSYEYHYLKNLLRRDSRITVAGWLMSADPDFPQEGDVSLKRLPATAQDLFEYDVVVLLDIDVSGLPAAFLGLLDDFVSQHHGGLAYVAGDKFSLTVFESTVAASLRNLLPVSVETADLRGELEQGLYYEREWAPLPTPEASVHASTRLSSQPDRNRDRWAEIAGFYWSFPVARVKPGATVLLEHSNPALVRDGRRRPLLVTQYYGGGRVMWCGIDSTWRWRALAEEVYDRFWIQSVRYLTEGRLLRKERFLIQTDRDAYDFGETVRVSVHALDENYKPVATGEVRLSVIDPEGAERELALPADGSAPGWFRGLYTPRKLGNFLLRGEGSEHRVAVDPPRIEFQEPQLNESALRELATRTRGSYRPISELSTLPEDVPDRVQTVVTTDEPIPLWDNWFCLSLLVGILTLEWILRKWNRLL